MIIFPQILLASIVHATLQPAVNFHPTFKLDTEIKISLQFRIYFYYSQLNCTLDLI